MAAHTSSVFIVFLLLGGMVSASMEHWNTGHSLEKRSTTFGRKEWEPQDIGYFCGDTYTICQGWFNRWINWRFYVNMNGFYDGIKGLNGPTEMELKRLELARKRLEFHEMKLNRTLEVWAMEKDLVLDEIQREEELQKLRMTIVRKILHGKSI
ncbi:uncharacterized protein LOC131882273 [Tigriopus californicus]|uniref:uncharacterized protein LOC131882273 n=1 Tax=Tigriopus californicus TaxID=6832 RepID=UPI0027DA5ABD|nr:uncharacterized protein LOC131882273 [Tigriopus californicus]